MSIGEGSRAKHDEVPIVRQRAARWLRGGVAALVVMFVAGIFRAGVLVHGDTAGQILKGIEIAAVIVSIGSFFRWAVLYERAKP